MGLKPYKGFTIRKVSVKVGRRAQPMQVHLATKGKTKICCEALKAVKDKIDIWVDLFERRAS